jgi:DeoD family purine-nucleoside phosphorylase
MPATIHVHPTAPLAPRVLLPGDPARALLLAQELLEQPKMFNHNRGLWGYSGTAHDGAPLTIQSTGMGGPSAAIVATELIELGAATLVRVGTCGGLGADLTLGELVIATAALPEDGTSRALGASGPVSADAELVEALGRSGAARAGPVASSDLFYDEREHLMDEWAQRGALAVEMECATLFTLAGARGVRAGALLIVSDLVRGSRARIDVEELHAAELRAGELGARALEP